MKQLKLILTSMAIVIAVIAAFALRETHQDCTANQQYYFDGSMYKPAGNIGTDYLCVASTDTCTYVQEVDFYMPCRSGKYTPLR